MSRGRRRHVDMFERFLIGLIDRKAVHLRRHLRPLPRPSYPSTHPPWSSPRAILLFPQPYFFISISDMSQSSSSFQNTFDASLQNYQDQTGTRLAEHPLAKRLEECDSVDSIVYILQEQTQIFRKFRGDNGKLFKSIKSSVVILYTLSNSTVLGGGIGLVRPKSFIGVPCSQSSLYSHSCP